MQYVTLNNGIKMPVLGYGVYQIPPEDTERCVSDALAVGYRSIDTAQAYRNEDGVGNAVSASGIARNELFITTKVWISNYGYENTLRSIDESLSKLKTDYVDLFLIHQPFGDVYGAYKALIQAHKDGKIRAVGVSNFLPDRLTDMALFNELVPAVNQIEAHAFWQRKWDLQVAQKLGVQPMSWASFAEGRNDYFTNPVLTEIGNKYNKTVAQTALRFLIQKGFVVIPKTVNKARMQQNLNVFDFELSAQDVATIESLDQNRPLFVAHNTVEAVERFHGFTKR